VLTRKGRWAGLALVIAIIGCRDRDRTAPQAEEPAAAPLEVASLAVSAAGSPRQSPLVAGERLRVDVQIRGGQPPYRVALHADAPPAPEPAEPAIEAATELAASGPAVEAALGAALRPEVGSGLTRARLTVTDAAGRSAHADSGDLVIIGADAPRLADDAPGPRVLDAAGRRRTYYFRGEQVVVEAALPEAVERASVSILSPGGAVLTEAVDRPVRGGRLRLPLGIPRLAPAGRYLLEIRAGEHRERGDLEVRGEPFAPLSQLTAEALELRGGPDGMAPRAARLEPGEVLTVEVRVGGSRGPVTGRARLRAPGGEVHGEEVVATAEPAAVGATHRFLVAGRWTVPRVAPGRYTLEVEVTAGDDVSSMFRSIEVDE
jgi:hypothetical protein